MIAAFVARAMADRGIHYGWLMAGLVFLAGLCEFGRDERPVRASDADEH